MEFKLGNTQISITQAESSALERKADEFGTMVGGWAFSALMCFFLYVAFTSTYPANADFTQIAFIVAVLFFFIGSIGLVFFYLFRFIAKWLYLDFYRIKTTQSR